MPASYLHCDHRPCSLPSSEHLHAQDPAQEMPALLPLLLKLLILSGLRATIPCLQSPDSHFLYFRPSPPVLYLLKPKGSVLDHDGLFTGAFQVELVVKIPPANAETLESPFQSPGREDPLEEGMAIHFSILAWRIPWTEEPGGLQSIGLHRVRHD